VTDAGFTMARIENYYLVGPKSIGYTYEGTANK